MKEKKKSKQKKKQGRIHGNPVADSWAGAVMRKPLEIQKCDGRTDGPTDGRTDRHGKVQSRVSATKKVKASEMRRDMKPSLLSNGIWMILVMRPQA